MRAALLAALIFAGCVRTNQNFLDPLAQVDGGVADLGSPDDLALPTEDLSGPRLVFAPVCGGVSGSIATLTGLPFTMYLRIADGANNPIDTDADVTLAIESSDQPTTLTGGGTVKASHGMVSFTASLDHWATGQLIATSPGIAALEVSFTVHGSHAEFVTQPSDTVAAQTMAPSVQVAFTDETGSRDENITSMSLGLSGCGQSASNNIATASTVAGVATFDHLAIGPACDSYQLQLNVGFYYGAPLVSTTFKVTKGPPSQLVLSTARRFVTRRQPFTVVASIEDAGGNVIAVAPTPVTLSLAGAPLGGTTTQTTNAGVATLDGLVIDPVGTYTLTGHAAGVPDATLALRVSSWEFRAQPFAADSFGGGVSVAIDDPATVYAWRRDQSLVSHDGGLTWSLLRDYPFAGPIIPDPTDATTLWSVGGEALFRSPDRGATWEGVGPGNFEVAAMLIGKASPHTLLVLGNNESQSGGYLGSWISSDGGASWHTGGPTLAAGDSYFDAAITPNGTMYVSAGQYTAGPPVGFLARSVDGGTTWTKLQGVPILRDLVADPFVPTTIFASRLFDGVFSQSADSGTTWTFTGDSSSGGIVVPNPALQGHYLLGVGSTYGVLLSTDGAKTWTTSFDPHDTQRAFADGIAFAPSLPSTVYLALDDGIFRSLTGGE